LTLCVWNKSDEFSHAVDEQIGTKRSAAKLGARVNQIPPNSTQVDLNYVPTVGPTLSGTHAKDKTASSSSPSKSVVIAGPKGKW